MQVTYNSKTYETSMQKGEWRETLVFPAIAELGEVEVVVVEKGGIFRNDS